MGRSITEEIITGFQNCLREEEKSAATVRKYIHDVKRFTEFTGKTEIERQTVLAFKQRLIDSGYAVRSINSMIASLNSLFAHLGWHDLKVKSIRLQRQVFCPEDRELTMAEYQRLCRTAQKRHNKRLDLILQTICGTGIRVSELRFITVESLKRGEAAVNGKGKIRHIFIVRKLQKKITPLCGGAGNQSRISIYHTYREANEPDKHLEGNESIVRRGKCKSNQGFPP